MSLAADLKELRKLLGVKHCPNCLTKQYGSRAPPTLRDIEGLRVTMSQAREAFLEGSFAAAVRLLKPHGLNRAHLLMSCPLLALRHFILDALVPERLHERCEHA